MKKLYWLFIAFALLIIGVLAYLFKPMTMNDIYSEPNFSGVVDKVYDNSILVSVNSEEEIFKTSDTISVSLNVKLKDSMTHINIGDEVSIYYDGTVAESYPAQINTVYAIILTEPATSTDDDAIRTDLIPMLMVDGKLHYDTGKESDIKGRCGVMDGEITSTVDGSEIPTKDNQSNFGEGYGYQFVSQNSIDVYMNEKWIRFENKV